MRLSMNTRYAVIHASFWGAYGSLWAFIALVLEYNGFASAQVGVVTSCATLLSVFLSPAVSSFLDARPGLENRHGAMALLTLAAALCLLVWLVPLPRPFVLGACFALIGALLSSTPPFQNAMAMDANRCGIPVVYGFCRGVGSVSYAAAVLLLGFVLERHAPATPTALADAASPWQASACPSAPMKRRTALRSTGASPPCCAATRASRSPCSAVCSFSSPTPSPTPI